MVPSPLDVQGVDQGVDGQPRLVGRGGCQMGVSGGGQDADMAQYLLQLKQIDPGLQHVGGIAVAQGVA